MKKIFIVTGAMGYLGNNIVRKLLDRGEIVRCLALKNDQCESLKGLDVQIFRGDICDIASLEDIFSTPVGYDVYVIHAAGIVTIASKYNEAVWKVNVDGTANIVKMCEKCHVKKLVYVSSIHTIPEAEGILSEVDRFDPDAVEGLYAKTKATASNLVLDAAARGLDAVVVQPAGIIGPGDYGRGHITQMVKDYVDGRLIAGVKGGGYAFVDVRDVADGILAACDKGRAGQCYILSKGYCSVQELLDILHQVTGLKKVKTMLPMWFAKLTAPLAELYYKIRRQPALFTPYSLYTLTCNGNFSNEKAVKELGFSPRSMEDTLRDTVQWLSVHGQFKNKRRLRMRKRANNNV